MRALALAVALHASPALAQAAQPDAAAAPAAPAASGAPEAAHPERSGSATAETRSRGAATATATPAGSPEAAHPERSDSATAEARSRGTSPTATPAGSPEAGPSAAVAEKLAQGDRAFGAGDFRGALFAYQDAVYLQPGYAFARVKLGRAYLALRYPAQAIAQAELVLAADPADEEARRLSDDARAPRSVATGPAVPPVPSAPSPGVAPPSPGAAAPAGAAAAAAPSIPAGATVVVVMPAGSAPALALPSAAAAPAPSTSASPQPRMYRLPPEGAGAPAPAASAPGALPSAGQRYRSALDLVARRDYAGAIALLNEAIALEPRLAVAYTARASARFGLGRFREAADDYKAALGLDPALATPLYGLGECYRLLGDPLAAELYARYAASRASDVREDLRVIARDRAEDLSRR
ncbi:tetratricopeptide repeat protein [Anaeromyxobacter sp. Fw109-5]|uniref:tetratricopeptide repeat protein n=1 Tax=Anaeromyxobacter sp. (strain Fw109-5) TaxID=404589 RepID=UPI0000ED75E8|nr:tetratricopeptide repeat protein [Anaeromyxobacter sp. Fw109-5]ABS26704.1 Tetratricopeptide TPR_2 repeat protein [Anaeromyxobacter sp. Fw109-5]